MSVYEMDVREMAAAMANAGVMAYQATSGEDLPSTRSECEIVLAALLVDLQRWADALGVDFDVALGMAEENRQAQERLYAGRRPVRLSAELDFVASWTALRNMVLGPFARAGNVQSCKRRR